jgi:hypothetical protein
MFYLGLVAVGWGGSGSIGRSSSSVGRSSSSIGRSSGSISWGSSSIGRSSSSIGWFSSSVSWGSSSISWGSGSIGRSSSSSVGWGSFNNGGSGNRLVDSVAGLLNDRCLDNLLNRVDLVGLGYGVGLGNLDGVGPGNLLLVDDGAFDGDRVGHGDLDWDLVDVELRLDPPHLRGDDGVGTDRGDNPLLLR